MGNPFDAGPLSGFEKARRKNSHAAARGHPGNLEAVERADHRAPDLVAVRDVDWIEGDDADVAGAPSGPG
jgi:hypothetical protein